MPRTVQPNAIEHLLPQRREGDRRLTRVARWLVGYKVEEVERKLILTSLSHYCGNRTWAANALGISIRTLRNKINEYTAQGLPVVHPLGTVHRMPKVPTFRELLEERSNADPDSDANSSTAP